MKSLLARPERFPGGKETPATPPKPTISGQHQHRISRRSTMTKHGKSVLPNETPLQMLQRRLRPEWEVDYTNEASDAPDQRLGEAMDTLLKGEYRSLQEMRYVETLQKPLQDDEITAKIDKLEKYQGVLRNSREYLQPLAEYLDNFGSELKKLSLEMEFLQKRSDSLNSDIEDKKLLDAKLTPLINDLAIPPEVVRSIVTGPIDRDWVENLSFLQEKRQIYGKYTEGGTGSVKELRHLLDMLEQKCVERVRNFMIESIKQLRKPGTASQVVQKKLLNAKETFAFLSEREPQLAKELKQAYYYTMRWYYHQNFVKYLYSLEKLKLTKVDKNVLLGSLEDERAASSSGGFFSRSSQPVSEVSITEYLINIPKRFETLTSGDQTAMLAQIAETNNTKYWIETGFRNFNQALLDNVSTEYLFLNEFFNIKSLEEATEVTKIMFGPVYELGHSYTKHLIENSHDWFGVLIMVRLCQSLEYELQHRRVPVLEDYLNYQQMILWPKFQNLIDQNCSEMKRAASSSAVIQSISKNVMVPLPLTQNFGTVLTNLIRLSSNLMFEIETWEPLTNSVMRLSNEFESAMLKLSKNVAGKKKQEVFLYNNFFLIYTILCNEIEEEHTERPEGTGEVVAEELGGKKTLAETEKEHFKRLIEAYGE